MFEVFKQDNQAAPYTSKRILSPVKKRNTTVSHPAFKALVAFNIIGAMVAGYLYFNRQETAVLPGASEEVVSANQTPETPKLVRQAAMRSSAPRHEAPAATPAVVIKKDSVAVPSPPAMKTVQSVQAPVSRVERQPVPEKSSPAVPDAEKHPHPAHINETVSYTVAGPQVYFHTRPDERTRRNAFINRWNKAVLKPLDEENGFVYIVYTNQWGQTSKGWMLKKQLKPLN